MGDRAPFVVGALVIVAVVAWLVLRGDDAHDTVTTETTKATPAGPAKVSAPEGPSLSFGGSGTTKRPELPTQPASPTPEQVFSDETRDDAWAEHTEAELQKRWKNIRGGKLESAECHHTQCRLVVTGSEADVSTAIADLEGARGLHGFAQNVLLTGPSKNDDGTIALRIYARFER